MLCTGRLFEGHPIAAHPAVLIFSFCVSLFFSFLICHTPADYHQRQRLPKKHDKKKELNKEESAKLLILICKKRTTSVASSLCGGPPADTVWLTHGRRPIAGCRQIRAELRGVRATLGATDPTALALIYGRPEGRSGPGREPRGYRVTGHRVPMSRSLLPSYF